MSDPDDTARLKAILSVISNIQTRIEVCRTSDSAPVDTEGQKDLVASLRRIDGKLARMCSPQILCPLPAGNSVVSWNSVMLDPDHAKSGILGEILERDIPELEEAVQDLLGQA